MGPFIENNLGVLVTLAMAAIGAGIWLIRLEGRVSTQTTRLDGNFNRLADVERILREHLLDSSRHVDPVRDERRWQELRESIKEVRDDIRDIKEKVFEG